MHPGARQRARVWAVATDPRKRWPHRHGECVKVPQQLELEATTKSSNHVYRFPSLYKTEVHKYGCNHTAPSSGTSPTHRACICTCAFGRLGTPQPVHATTRGKERAEENRWLMEESAFFIESSHWRKVGWCASFTKGERPTRCCGAHCRSV